jgi:undecaprenyl-diphosphatase
LSEFQTLFRGELRRSARLRTILGRGPLRLIRWLLKRLHGLYAVAGVLLSAGLLAALLALWGLSGITENVLEGETLRFDQSVLRWMNQQASSTLDFIALNVTALGSSVVVVTVAVITAILLWLVGRPALAAMIGAAVGGASILSPVLKGLFSRPRPDVFESIVPIVTTSAYPSGHATMAMVLFVVVAYVVHRLGDGRRLVSLLAALAGSFVILIVGLSRVYLGVHYPTDVLAGYGVGFVWAVFCVLTVEGMVRVRQPSARS